MNNLIIVDTREKGHKKIIEYFDKVGQDYIVSKLESGDYMLYKDYTTVIDKKDTLLELAGNLCNTLEHKRINREIDRAKELGCTNFIFLIQDNKIKSFEDIKNWHSSYMPNLKGEVLLKIMNTMKERYGVRFMIVPKKDMGKTIIDLLTK
jgi:ERCC4-type nuclease